MAKKKARLGIQVSRGQSNDDHVKGTIKTVVRQMTPKPSKKRKKK